MKRIFPFLLSLLTVLLCFIAEPIIAQVAINKTGASADDSAILDISSDDSGLLTPRMTYAQRVALTSSPLPSAAGMLVYQTNTSGIFGQGFYQLTDDGTTWIRQNVREQYRASIIMGITPTLASGDLPGASLSTISVGSVRVDIPGLGSNAVVLVSPEFKAVGTPPTPADYCETAFSGNCATRFNNRGVYVTQPAGMILSATGYSPPLETFLHHCPTAASCNVGTTDYQFHNNTSTLASSCFGFFGQPDSWNGTFSFSTFVGVDLNSLAAGSDFDLTLTGNNNTGGTTPISVFIDWNQDGDFFDTVDGISEVIVNTPSRLWPVGPFSYANATGSSGSTWLVTVPPNAVNGKTNMRVMAAAIPQNLNPCTIFNNGSARDYAFVISGGVAPTYPGETRTCNVYGQNASGFEVHCFKSRNAEPVDDRFYLLINPQY